MSCTLSSEIIVQKNTGVLVVKFMGMLQQCVGGRFLDVKSVQEVMRRRNVQFRWRKLCVLAVGVPMGRDIGGAW